MATTSELLEKAERLKAVVMASVTGGEKNEEEFKQLRGELMADETVKSLLPRFVRAARILP